MQSNHEVIPAALGERVAFKWYNLWSSAETRAAIDDVMERYRTEMPEAFTRIPECDRRHFVSYTGSVLEYKVCSSTSSLDEFYLRNA